MAERIHSRQAFWRRNERQATVQGYIDRVMMRESPRGCGGRPVANTPIVLGALNGCGAAAARLMTFDSSPPPRIVSTQVALAPCRARYGWCS